MGMVKEFSEFLKKYQVIGLAVAFIMGAAAGKLVTALVNDLIMPIVGFISGSGADWRTSALNFGTCTMDAVTKKFGGNGCLSFQIGDFLGALIDFIIVAFVIFMIVKMIMKEDATAKR